LHGECVSSVMIRSAGAATFSPFLAVIYRVRIDQMRREAAMAEYEKTIEAFLDEEGLLYTHTLEEGLHRFDYSIYGQKGLYRILLHYDQETELLNFMVPNLAFVCRDKPRALEVYSLLLKWNYRLTLARFCVDDRDGEISLEISLPAISEEEPSKEVLKRLLRLIVIVADLKSPMIQRCLYGDDPDKARTEDDLEERFLELMQDLYEEE
jgi:hypothetical protein